MEVTREMAHTMALWWGEKIAGLGSHHDNGDHSNQASVLAGLLADTMNRHADESQINKFVDILTEKILKQVDKKGYLYDFLLYCDYAPSKFLSDAAKEAGIDDANFPWKTGMSIDERDPENLKVIVRDGYRAEPKQIYPVNISETDKEIERHRSAHRMWRRHKPKYFNDDGTLTEEGKERYFR